MKKILIIGLGLIGGSFAKALRAHKIGEEIFALDENIDTIEAAKNAGIINGFSVIDQSFDLIVIATPLSTYEKIIAQISDVKPQNSVIIDLGSLKEFVVKKIPKNLEQNFVACHPIAGSDKSGFEHSFAELFLDKKFVICNKNNATKIAENIINKIGGNVEFIDAKPHDEIYGLVSHLPQFLSFLTKEFSPKNNTQNAFRLDNSSPDIWSDIFKINEKNLEKFYFEFFENLEKIVEKLENKDFAKIIDEISAQKTFNKNAPCKEEFPLDENTLFRLIIVSSYLKIAKIKDFQNYAGSGFRDFTSIISVIECDKDSLLAAFAKNQKEILEFIKTIQ